MLKEASMNISLSGNTGSEVNELWSILKNAGMESPKIMAISSGPPEGMDAEPHMCPACAAAHGADTPCGETVEEVDEDWDNSPDEEYQDSDYMIKDLSGGINRSKIHAALRAKDPAITFENYRKNLKDKLEETYNKLTEADDDLSLDDVMGDAMKSRIAKIDRFMPGYNSMKVYDYMRNSVGGDDATLAKMIDWYDKNTDAFVRALVSTGEFTEKHIRKPQGILGQMMKQALKLGENGMQDWNQTANYIYNQALQDAEKKKQQGVGQQQDVKNPNRVSRTQTTTTGPDGKTQSQDNYSPEEQERLGDIMASLDRYWEEDPKTGELVNPEIAKYVSKDVARISKLTKQRPSLAQLQRQQRNRLAADRILGKEILRKQQQGESISTQVRNEFKQLEEEGFQSWLQNKYNDASNAVQNVGRNVSQQAQNFGRNVAQQAQDAGSNLVKKVDDRVGQVAKKVFGPGPDSPSKKYPGITLAQEKQLEQDYDAFLNQPNVKKHWEDLFPQGQASFKKQWFKKFSKRWIELNGQQAQGGQAQGGQAQGGQAQGGIQNKMQQPMPNEPSQYVKPAEPVQIDPQDQAAWEQGQMPKWWPRRDMGGQTQEFTGNAFTPERMKQWMRAVDDIVKQPSVKDPKTGKPGSYFMWNGNAYFNSARQGLGGGFYNITPNSGPHSRKLYTDLMRHIGLKK